VTRDLKDWIITVELALDRREWKLAIHEPIGLRFLLFYYLFYSPLFTFFLIFFSSCVSSSGFKSSDTISRLGRSWVVN
jgi:hypothetical protein